MDFDFFNTLILTGIIQGFLFAGIVFFTHKYKSKSNYFLAALILSFSFNNLQYLLQISGILSGSLMFKTIYIPLGSLNPVFLYLYIITFLYPEKKIQRKLYLLFIPFVIAFIYILTYKIYNLVTTINKSVFAIFKTGQDIQSVMSFIYTIALFIFSFSAVYKYDKKQSSYLAKKIMIKVQWLKITLFILLLLTIFWGYVLSIYLRDKNYAIWFKILWLGMSIAIYWLGHAGIYNFGIIATRKKIRSKSKKHTIAVEQNSKNPHIQAFEKLIITEKKYKDPSLTLEEVSKKLNISKTYLSRIIHAELDKSFTDYINTLRVEEVKTLLKDAEFSKYTLIAIGLEAGFNSKSSFNTVFKKYTGLTPSAFKKSHQIT